MTLVSTIRDYKENSLLTLKAEVSNRGTEFHIGDVIIYDSFFTEENEASDCLTAIGKEIQKINVVTVRDVNKAFWNGFAIGAFLSVLEGFYFFFLKG